MNKKLSAVVNFSANVGNTFKTAIGDTTKGLEGIGKSIRKIETQQSKIKALEFKGLNEAKGRLEIAKDRFENLREEVSRTNKPTKKLVTRMQSARRAIDRAKRSVDSKQASLVKLNRDLRESGVNTKRLTNENDRLGKSLDKLKSRYQRLGQARKLSEKAKDARSNLAGKAVGVAATGAAFAVPIREAIEFESVMTDVSKNVDGLSDPTIAKEFEGRITEISEKSPLAAHEIARLVSEAGKIGLVKEDALEFAKVSEQMGVAFDLTADEAGGLITKIKSSMGLTIPEVAKLGDVMNMLGDTTASNAANIAQILQRQGGLLISSTNLSKEQIAALAASIDSAAPNAEMAATAMKNFSLALIKGESATSSQQKALEALGFTSEEMAERMQDDAQGAIMDVLEALKELDDVQRGAVEVGLFGSESIGAIAPLLNSLDKVKSNFKSATSEIDEAKTVSGEYRRVVGTTANQMKIFTGRIGNLGKSIGAILLPPLNSAMSVIGSMAGVVRSFAERFPNLTKAIVIGGAAITVLTGALIAGGIALSFIATGVSGAITGFTILSPLITTLGATVLPLVIGAVKALGVALLATPVGWIIGGIAAIVASVYLIYKHWEPIKGFFVGLFEMITNPIENWRELLMTVFGFSPLGMVMKAWSPVIKYLTNKFDWISKGIGKVKSFFGLNNNSESEGSGKSSELGSKEFQVPELSSGGNKTMKVNQNMNINVTAAPGQDPNEIVSEIQRQAKEQQEAFLGGGALFDTVL